MSGLLSRKTFIVLFFTVFVIGVGLLSFAGLMKYYIDDEPNSYQWVPGRDSKFETDMANNFYEQFQFVNLNGLMARAMGKRELNNIIRLNNGYLTDPSPAFEEELITRNTGNIIKFNDYLKEKGIFMIFAITPNTSAKYDPQMPAYFSDHGNENLDIISGKLTAGAGVTVRKGVKVGRNDPCPCGSGKKYKNCCGRNAGSDAQ